MATKYAQDEIIIARAIEKMSKEAKPNISATARDFGVSYDRLRDRFQGRQSKIDRRSPNCKLSIEQDAALRQYLIKLDQTRSSASPSILIGAANAILAKSHNDLTQNPPTVGKKWRSRWLKANPIFHIKKEKTIDVERKNAQNPVIIEAWFAKYKSVLDQYQIKARNIWNFDETGMQIGMGRDRWIITCDSDRQTYVGNTTNREQVTVIECINAACSYLPPMFVLAGRVHMEHWYENLEDDNLIAISESGYINDTIALGWIYYFIKYSSVHQIETYRMLLMDGAGSHCTYEFLKICEENRIIPFCLPPKITHFLQPLDVVIFQPYKHYHSQEIELATRSGCKDFNKAEFLAAIHSIRESVFKETTLQSSFRKTGLWPFNPSPIIKLLKDQLPRTPPAQNANADPLQLSTPLTIRGLNAQAEVIRRLDFSPSTKKKLETFTKGSLVQANEAVARAHDLSNLQDRKSQRQRRQNAGQKQSRKGGILYSRDARKMKKDREETELEKAQAIVQRAKKAQAVRNMKDFKKFHVEERKRLRALKSQNPGAARVYVEVTDPASSLVSYSV